MSFAIPGDTQILEEGEYCVVCLGVDHLGAWHLIGTTAELEKEPFDLTLCQTCYDDKSKLKQWLTTETEKALEADPTMEKQSDGKWRRRAA